MAERIRDDIDERLVSLFDAEPVADDGFSERVTRKIRWRLWMRRLTIPVAAAIGGAIALQPLAALVTVVVGFINSLPLDIVASATTWIPPLPTIALGAVLLVAMLLGLGMLED